MSTPMNLDDYYQKMLALRDQLKGFKNSLTGEAADLADVSDEDLAGWGLDAAKVSYERARLDAAAAVAGALDSFDAASV